MVKTEENVRTRRAPTLADESTGNLQTQLVTHGATAQKTKSILVQCNVKVRPRARDRFEAAYKKALSASPDMTKGDFFEAMLAAFEAKGGPVMKVAEAARPVPPASDQSAGRTVALDLFATPAFAKHLSDRAHAVKATVSAVVEHACAEAKELKQPCPKCGHKRV